MLIFFGKNLRLQKIAENLKIGIKFITRFLLFIWVYMPICVYCGSY